MIAISPLPYSPLLKLRRAAFYLQLLLIASASSAASGLDIAVRELGAGQWQARGIRMGWHWAETDPLRLRVDVDVIEWAAPTLRLSAVVLDCSGIEVGTSRIACPGALLGITAFWLERGGENEPCYR